MTVLVAHPIFGGGPLDRLPPLNFLPLTNPPTEVAADSLSELGSIDYGFAGRFKIAAKIQTALEIQFQDPTDGKVQSIWLNDYKPMYPPQLKSANGSIYRAKAVVPHSNGTFTVVSMGGVISHWTCEKVITEAERLLHSVQVPGTLMSKAHLLQVASVADRVFVTAIQEGSMKLYLYYQDTLSDETPGIPFNRIEAGDSCLVLKVHEQVVGELEI